MKPYATVDTGLPCFLASERSVASSVSVNITATRFRRESGEGPLPDPFGRPAPGRRPPQVPFFFAVFFFDFLAAMPSPIEELVQVLASPPLPIPRYASEDPPRSIHRGGGEKTCTRRPWLV